MEKLHIAIIVGSLRAQSYNRSLANAAVAIGAPDVEFEILEIKDLPLYNFDIENPPPPSVAAFKEKIEKADALLLVTPEYNYSVPGVLKNAIDWATRPSKQSSVENKLVGLMGASDGRFGTARAQYHLRQILQGSHMLAFSRPEVLVTFADKKFDASGNLIDEETKKVISNFLVAFAAWIHKQQ